MRNGALTCLSEQSTGCCLHLPANWGHWRMAESLHQFVEALSEEFLFPTVEATFFSDVLNQSSTSKHRFWAIFQKKLVCCSEMCFLENLFSHKHFFDKYIFKVAGLRVCLLYKSKLFVWISFLLEKSECSSHIQKCCLFILSSKG